jgi:competence protein ComEC
LALEAERRRLFLWLPAWFAGGVLLYFAADTEPTIWPPLIGLILFGGLAVALRRHWRSRMALIAVAAIFAGFLACVVRTASVTAPVLARVSSGPLTGFVESVEERIVGARLVVVVASFADLDTAALPQRVRLTTRARAEVKPGDFISVMARLLPPPEPARPGGYDFARDSFFRGVGAVGSMSGPIRIVAPPTPPGWQLRFAASVDVARNVLTRRIAQAFGGQAGAVAAALVTGKRGLISEDTNNALRAAGIYHIVSISGLHMVLAAGAFLWATRALLALVPAIVLTWPVKKIAAVGAMAGATGYCIFSGSDVATERSLYMILVMLGAILVDRPVLSMRNLAIAALICLASEPESLLGPSFEMSFAAVAGLIAFCEQPRRASGEKGGKEARHGIVRRLAWSVCKATATILVTTIVATFATAPFSAYHFQTLNPLGVFGNALALPLIELIVMPAAVVGVIAYPFGLDAPIWWLTGLATQPVLYASGLIGSLAHSTLVVPAFGAAALGCLVCAILWLTLWTTALRWFAAAPALLGLVLVATTERPTLMVDRQAAGVALRGGDGRFVLLGRPSGFVADQWLKADGDGRRTSDPTLKAGVACDKLGCVAHLPDGRAVSLVLDKRAFGEDCRRAAIIVSRLAAPPTCKASLVLDRRRLGETGSVTVAITANSMTLSPSRDPQVMRPWLRQAETRRRRAVAPISPAGEAAPQASHAAPQPKPEEASPEKVQENATGLPQGSDDAADEATFQ